MRKTTLRRLEALEKENRSCEERELSLLLEALVYLWRIVLAYYLGGLKSSEKEPREAHARALNYRSGDDFSDALLKEDPELDGRFNDAYRRLFAKAGLDFDSTPRDVLFDAFVTMVNQLPEQRLNWLRSNLQRWCPEAEIAVGSNVPRGLSGDNFLAF